LQQTQTPTKAPAAGKILSQTQAEAVYSAMRALNKVGATIRASIPTEGDTLVFIEECADSGQITVTRGLRRVACHASQSTFATAYGLENSAVEVAA